jgi:hypothetical protein
MSYITKFQASSYFGVSDKNKIMRENKIDVKFGVEEDFNGEWILKKSTSCGNLPDKIKEYRKAKIALELAYESIKIKRAAWDNL